MFGEHASNAIISFGLVLAAVQVVLIWLPLKAAFKQYDEKAKQYQEQKRMNASYWLKPWQH